ncbi:putative conserved leucine-rich repeat protein [Diplodia seriata]|uniref:Putative conserved leucine-rich repeat protein n=1 Tax=Diplodia seriata TaxID=420778 RepID=A0A0G2DVC9_9PEZI|nr:putative conserved leucine-rich repeat protein [Diplodia seriata]
MSDRHANYIPKHIRREETIMEMPSPEYNEDSEHDFKSFDDEVPLQNSRFSFVSGEDEHELPNRTLVKRNGAATVNVLEDRYAQGTMELIKALQDNEPEEPFWEDLRRLDLQQKDLPTLNRLDELCYRIEALDVSNNHIAQLAGAPTTLRRLNISNNCLNKLKVDDNEVDSLDGVLELDGLLKLSAKGNKIKRVDFQGAYLERLTELDLSDNEIHSVRSLDTLKSLETLNLDENELSTFSFGRVSKVKQLGLNRNRLEKLDVSSFPRLETLAADSNNLSSLSGIAKLKHLRVLSARDQHPASGIFDTTSFLANADISELYLSSNTIPTLSFPEDNAGNTTPLLNLQRLELASCGLRTLPDKFGAVAPNIRSLNLNFNALKELRPLLNSKKLARLDLAGNRLSRLRRNVLVLAKVPSLRAVDLRNNAFNVGFYPPPSADRRVSRAGLCISIDDDNVSLVSGEHSLLEQEAEQQRQPQHLVLPSADDDRDRAYLARLDADTALRRRVYEMLVAGACGGVRALDGLALRRDEAMRRDEVWERLVGLGVVVRKKSRP